MRLEFAISEMAVGGAERVVIDLLRDAYARGDQLALLAKPGPLDAELGDIRLQRRSLPTARTPLAVARATGRTARFTHAFAPELIHAHNPRVTAIAVLGAHLSSLGRRPPILSTYQGAPHGEAAAAARALRLADLVVCVSDDLAAQMRQHGVPESKLAVIPNAVPDAAPLSDEKRRGIDTEFGLRPDEVVVSAVGRFVPQKAHDRFLRSAALVKRHHQNVRFLIVGDGDLRSETEALAHDLGLERDVVFTGIRNDAQELIARSDLLVFSSLWEGLSIAALEALARGVPVISTDVEGMRGILTPGAGIVVDHDDEALAAAIEACLGDAQYRASLGATGRQIHADGYSTARLVKEYRELYETLLER